MAGAGGFYARPWHVVWLKLLETMPLSIAYPMLSINFVLITLIGQFVYKEQTGLNHWLGVAAIMFGILLMSIGV
ncbi:Undecaprenyl phosphate-aminoarabinose flippase subunit ArnE [Providencia rettgeri]|nr:Undecaprenyl phosphate-aminoarabinose flippase subunit ArnE [Providencia rettgeri]